MPRFFPQMQFSHFLSYVFKWCHWDWGRKWMYCIGIVVLWFGEIERENSTWILCWCLQFVSSAFLSSLWDQWLLLGERSKSFSAFSLNWAPNINSMALMIGALKYTVVQRVHWCWGKKPFVILEEKNNIESLGYEAPLGYGFVITLSDQIT